MLLVVFQDLLSSKSLAFVPCITDYGIYRAIAVGSTGSIHLWFTRRFIQLHAPTKSLGFRSWVGPALLLLSVLLLTLVPLAAATKLFNPLFQLLAKLRRFKDLLSWGALALRAHDRRQDSLRLVKGLFYALLSDLDRSICCVPKIWENLTCGIVLTFKQILCYNLVCRSFKLILAQHRLATCPVV